MKFERLATGTGEIYYTNNFSTSKVVDAAIFLADYDPGTNTVTIYIPALVSWDNSSLPAQFSGKLTKTFNWPSISGTYDAFAIIADSINPSTGAISGTYGDMIKENYVAMGISLNNFTLS